MTLREGITITSLTKDWPGKASEIGGIDRASKALTLVKRIEKANPITNKVLATLQKDLGMVIEERTSYYDLPEIPTDLLSDQEAVSLVVIRGINEGIIKPDFDGFYAGKVPEEITDAADAAVYLIKSIWQDDSTMDDFCSELILKDGKTLAIDHSSNNTGVVFSILGR